MIKVNVEQGSQAWRDARLGIPTASKFDMVLTPTGKPSAQADKLMDQLLAEWAIGEPDDNFQSALMSRGIELEPQAADTYAFQRGVELEKVGLCLRDDGLVGCSPDRLIDADGILEIKCPAAKTHIHYMRYGTVADDYKCQLQGNLYVTERQYIDIVSYNPVMPQVVIRIERDEAFIGLLRAALGIFISTMLSEREKLRGMGVIPRLEQIAQAEAEIDAEIEELFPSDKP